MNYILETLGNKDTQCTLSLNLLLLLGVSDKQGRAGITLNDRTLALPDNVKRLVGKIDKESTEHTEFLDRLAKAHFSPSGLASRKGISFSSAQFAKSINSLSESKKVNWIEEGVSNEQVHIALQSAFSGSRYEISLSKKRNFVRQYYVESLSWSILKESPLISRNVNIFDTLGRYIPALQVPINVALTNPQALLEAAIKKQELVGSILSLHPALQAGKFYVGIAAILGSKLDVLPERFREAAEITGVILAFTDP